MMFLKGKKFLIPDGEISCVEGIDAVPALRPELSALAHYGVEIAQ